jgi:hypothetical protein
VASRVNLPTYVSQATSQGPLGSSVAVNDATVGTYTWLTPEGVYDIGGGSAVNGSFGEVFHKVTKYLKATGFGFSIPVGATINGIVVEVRKDDGDDRADYDYAVRIVKGGAIGATDKSSMAQWSRTGLQYVTYGSSSDLWGETWSASDVNASNFGFAISAYNDTGTWDPIVDYIRITVYYTP